MIPEELQGAMDWLDGEREPMVALVKDWSSINSGTSNLEGLERMGAEVVSAFSALDASHQQIDVGPVEAVNAAGEVVECKTGPMHSFKSNSPANRRILFTGHQDTVFAADNAFQQWRHLDGDILNGPGVADMKGGLIVMLWALKAIEMSPLKERISYEILVSSDEETGSVASSPVLMDRASHSDFGMTFEPALADGTLAGRRKGSGNFTLVVKGRAAHAGREFYAGRNAILAVSRFVEELYALNGQCGEATFNPAVISGGTANNIVPDLAILRFNVRLGSEDEQSLAQSHIKRLVEKLNDEEGIEAGLHGLINRPPKVLSAANQRLFEILRDCGSDLGVSIAWKATGGCCEGNNLAAAGLPNIDTLGVRGGDIHSDKEFACLDSFVERAKLSALLIARHALGEIDLGAGVSDKAEAS